MISLRNAATIPIAIVVVACGPAQTTELSGPGATPAPSRSVVMDAGVPRLELAAARRSE